MTTLLTIIHVVACITLILIVLLQAGKGASMGAA
ncbi:MAG TPA: preprotein translocase subunit SecG, partial [Smithellaceae bacterium]|nr:preprotein translocase subunit SecG [Smithellaceae bacterium]